jgi:IS30 family transposase
LPKLARKSTALDNGNEHYLKLGCNQYSPKRTNFQLVSQETVNEVVASLNNTPRKILGPSDPSEDL